MVVIAQQPRLSRSLVVSVVVFAALSPLVLWAQPSAAPPPTQTIEPPRPDLPGTTWLTQVWPWLALSGLALILLGAAYGTYSYVKLSQRKQKLEEQRFKLLEESTENLRSNMELANLLNVNSQLLSQYHNIATRQANRSFWSANVAMFVGYLILILCLPAVIWLPVVTETRFAVAGLGAAAAALGAFLNRTFLHVYDQSLKQLDQFFSHPLLNSYFLNIERIVAREGELTDANMDLIKGVVEGLLSATTSLTQTRREASVIDIRKAEGKPQGPIKP